MLRSQPGIHSVKVALLAERGVVEFDPLQWDAVKVVNVSNSLSSEMLSESGA
jgi:Cu+-exporting ATPase